MLHCTRDIAMRLAKVHRTYVGRLERGESGVTVEALATILAALDVSLGEFFGPFTKNLPCLARPDDLLEHLQLPVERC